MNRLLCGCLEVPVFTIDNLPLPPSSNSQYVSFVKNGLILHKPSKELNQFKRHMEYSSIEHRSIFKAIYDSMNGKKLCIVTEFHFEKDSVYTKKETVKTMDVSNRIKAIHDSLSKAIGIDDKMFFKVVALKLVANKIPKTLVHLHAM